MTLRLLSWNVRELNNPQKREVCKNLLKEWKCDIVCLQETKVSTINVAFVWSLWGSPFVKRIHTTTVLHQSILRTQMTHVQQLELHYNLIALTNQYLLSHTVHILNPGSPRDRNQHKILYCISRGSPGL